MIDVNLLYATLLFSVKVALLMCQNNPMGIELFFHETTFFCFKIDECGLGEKKRWGGSNSICFDTAHP